MAKKIYLFPLLKFYSQTKLFIFTFVFKSVTFFFYFFSSWKAKEYGNPILLDKKKKENIILALIKYMLKKAVPREYTALQWDKERG